MSKQSGKKRRERKSGAPHGEERPGGLLTSMRGGFKELAGGKAGPKTAWQRTWDVLFWVLIVAALAFALVRRLR